MSEDVVRAGYDAIAREYASSRRVNADESSFLQDFADLLAPGATILDAGCGADVPITQRLSKRFTVTGVDISEEQIRFAQRAVPQARFLCGNLTEINFPPESFDAICSLYTVIHIPRDEHSLLLRRFHHMLKPRSHLLLSMGSTDWPGATEQFFGLPMYWSHYDAETNRRMIEDAGFDLIRSGLVAEGASHHLFLLARKRVVSLGR